MKYIKDISQYNHEVKQSKFIALLIPYSEYETKLKKLKQVHPKARHFVTAFRYINEYQQIVEHSSDDGEPKGTSGKPSLMVLQGQKLINTAVIIVRYFGGTKLGTGGLVRAYSDTVNLVINEAHLHEYRVEVEKTIYIDYSDVRLIDYECKEFKIKIVEKKFDSNILYKLIASEENMKSFLEKVYRLVK